GTAPDGRLPGEHPGEIVWRCETPVTRRRLRQREVHPPVLGQALLAVPAGPHRLAEQFGSIGQPAAGAPGQAPGAGLSGVPERLAHRGQGSGGGRSPRRYWDRLSWRYQLARIVSPSSSAASASRLLARPARPQAPDCRACRSASRPCTVARSGAPASNAALAVEPSASAISGGRRCWCPSRTARRYHWFASVWPASRSAHARSTITTPCRAT